MHKNLLYKCDKIRKKFGDFLLLAFGIPYNFNLGRFDGQHVLAMMKTTILQFKLCNKNKNNIQ